VFSGTVKVAYPIGSDDQGRRSSWSLTDVPDVWSHDDTPFTAVTDRVESTVAQAAAVAGDGIVGNSCDWHRPAVPQRGPLDEIVINLVPVLLGGNIRPAALWSRLRVDQIDRCRWIAREWLIGPMALQT
jgi:hypothetical protein